MKCVYLDGKLSSHVFVCWRCRFHLFLWIFLLDFGTVQTVVFFVFVLLNVKKMMKKDSPCYTNICNNVLYTVEAVDTLDWNACYSVSISMSNFWNSVKLCYSLTVYQEYMRVENTLNSNLTVQSRKLKHIQYKTTRRFEKIIYAQSSHSPSDVHSRMSAIIVNWVMHEIKYNKFVNSTMSQ